MKAYGLFETRDGNFIAEGTVESVSVTFQRMETESIYTPESFGRTLFFKREEAQQALEDAVCMEYERKRENPEEEE